jgi:hypothetical protein
MRTEYVTRMGEDNSKKWVPFTTVWRVLRLRMEERPADMEGSWEYIE